MSGPARERDVQNLIRLWCGSRGYLCFRANAGGVVTEDGKAFRTGLPNGFSDLMVLHHRTVSFVEVKSPTGRLRDDQRAFMEAVRSHGYEYLVARSVSDMDEAEKAWEKGETLRKDY